MLHQMRASWLVLGLPRTMYSGGTVRAGLVFADLCAQERAIPVRGRSISDAVRGIAREPGAIRGPRLLATSRMLPGRVLRTLAPIWHPGVFDVHDEPFAQAAALGIPESSMESWRTREAFAMHLARFPVLIAQTESFARLARLPEDRTLIIPNGTDAKRFPWTPPPVEPIVGLVSGASTGKGIETLIEAVRQARTMIPQLRLRMALAVSGAESAVFLRGLRSSCSADRWIEIVSVGYHEIPSFLGATSIVAVPHPPADYWDVIVPSKLFDSMMSGRPVVVTPRLETAKIVRKHQAGVVAGGDAVADLAEAITGLAQDPDRSAWLGQNARTAAEQHYDWSVLSKRVTRHMVEISGDVDGWSPDRRK